MNLMTYLCSRLITEKKKDKNKQDEPQNSDAESLGTLDNILQGNEKSTQAIKQFTDEVIKPNGPVIYAFITPKVPDAIKIGYTDQAPEKRIDQWRKIYDDNDNKLTCIGYWSAMEMDPQNKFVFFWDHAVHEKVSKRGYTHLHTPDLFKQYLEEKNVLTTIHVSREFFKKYKDLDKEKLEELSDKILEEILDEMKDNIKKGHPDFKVYKFDEKGNTTSEESEYQFPDPQPYENTGLQDDAIKNGVNAIKAGKKSLLMAAVMRFGKTHASYEIVHKAHLKRIIVVSAKADVRKSWRDDINHKHFYRDFVFVEFKDKYSYYVSYLPQNATHMFRQKQDIKDHDNIVEELANAGKTVIVFATLQDLTGSLEQMKPQHRKIFTKPYDMMIIDETHYGSHGKKYGQAANMNNEDDEDIEDSLADIKQEEKEKQELENGLTRLKINYEYRLQVSGTPYYILASNEFNKYVNEDSAIISKVSYTDMINARDKWEDDNNKKPKNEREDPSKSPYFGVPTLHKIGLRLTKDCEKAMRNADMTDSMGVLFTTYTTEKPKDGKKFRNKKLTNKQKLDGKFVNEHAIEDLMKGIFGTKSSNTLSFLGNKKVEGSKVCKHTMVVLPSISACQAMKRLLESFINADRKVICIVGKNADVKDIADLNNQLQEQENHGKYSVVLTVTKFLTGVSMPLLDSMLFMKNAQSPQDYDQAIFRLCTRYTKKVKQENDNDKEAPRSVNMKSNVYLIDFNFTTMFTMLANSARMKANADGITDSKKIEEYMAEDLKATPIFSEELNGEILDKIEKMDSKDLLKVYCGFNKNKSMSDIVDEGVNSFKNLFTNEAVQKSLLFMAQDYGKTSKNKKKLEDDREGNTSLGGGSSSFSLQAGGKGPESMKKKKSLSSYAKDQLEDKNGHSNELLDDPKAQAKLTKEQFKFFLHHLIYCNICLTKPYNDLKTMVDDADKNDEFKELLEDFDLKPSDLKKVYDAIPNKYRLLLNEFLMKFVFLTDNINDKDYNKIIRGIAELGGRFGKAEVVTPQRLVDKMLDKVGSKTFENADTILIVNSKSCEFVSRIKERYTETIAKKCRIVCSSKKTEHLIRKILNSMGMNIYINDMILPVEDRNHNNILYDDFLYLDNNKILKKWNMGKKFDVCLMNPPYGSTGGDTIHLKFVDKILDICNLQVTIMPFTFVTKINNATNNKFKEKFSKYLTNVEEVNSKKFDGVRMGSCGIYKFDYNKKDTDDIKIQYIDNNIETLKTLSDKQEFTNYEQNIIKHLINNGQQEIYGDCGRLNSWKKKVKNLDKNEKHIKLLELVNHSLKKIKHIFDENKVALLINRANGLQNGTCFSKGNGQIFQSYNDIVNFFVKNPLGIGYNALVFNNAKSAKNCKIALQHPLLRFTIYKLQDDQNMVPRVYKCVPAIDWSDDRVKTDEGLLEVCGCSQEKAKEYAAYCKDIIDKLDKGERP